MKPGTAIRYTRLPFLNRTGTVVEPLPRDADWPGYVRVQLDTAPDGSQGARLQLPLEALERVEKVGQLGFFGGGR
jgi:hypothetical protein